jgi:hypothetical protein
MAMAAAAACSARSHGLPQRRCACCRIPVLKRNCPYPLDRTMKWCNACKQAAYNRRRAKVAVIAAPEVAASAASTNIFGTIEAAAALTLLLHGDVGRAHAEDVEDALEDDVPCVSSDAGNYTHAEILAVTGL